MARRRSVNDVKVELERGDLPEAILKRLLRDPRSGVRDLVRREMRRRTEATAEAARVESLLTYERELWARGIEHVAGVDEVGAGPLAGPVVAAAVILAPGTSIAGIDDSKKLDAPTRERLAEEIKIRAVAYAIADCSVAEIDSLNILRASCEAMRRAVLALQVPAQHLLIDARRLALHLPQTPLIGGDGKSQSIAAASIIAKVHRDALMNDLGRAHPGYGFERHKGYSTPEHLEALKRLGRSPLHRQSFSPVALAEDAPQAQGSLF